MAVGDYSLGIGLRRRSLGYIIREDRYCIGELALIVRVALFRSTLPRFIHP